MNLAIFEDAEVGHFRPLARTRAAFDLRAGIFSFKERIERRLHHEADVLVCREQVSDVASEMHPSCKVNPERVGSAGPTLFVNGRWLPEEGEFLQALTSALNGDGPPGPVAWVSGDDLVAAWHNMEAEELRTTSDVRLVSRLWELVDDPGLWITSDAELLGEEFKPPAPWPDLTMVHDENIRIHETALLGAGVILNASSGPIVIEAEAVIEDGAILQGPCHIAPKARVRPGARIARSSIGYNSRAGGEISKSVLHAHCNKAHDGYVGNSYIGEWCNIGADANTSNLRNDYGPVSLYNEELGEQESTGRQFVGLIMGDHSVCGINTMFNTATVVGVCCNLFGPGYQPRYVRSFSWGGREKMIRHRFDKAVAAAEAMMTRRDRVMSEVHRDLLERIDRER